MAKSRKNTTPSTNEIVVPQSLAPLMQAFHVDTEQAAHSLILEASKAIYGEKQKDYDFTSSSERELSTSELESVSSLMRGISPRDALETFLAAQIVATHLLGMKKLSCSYREDQQLGLKLLKFSGDAMQQLQRKRNGGTQNINVSYNYHGSGHNQSQTIIKEK